jgi:hypothetical protein
LAFPQAASMSNIAISTMEVVIFPGIVVNIMLFARGIGVGWGVDGWSDGSLADDRAPGIGACDSDGCIAQGRGSPECPMLRYG